MRNNPGTQLVAVPLELLPELPPVAYPFKSEVRLAPMVVVKVDEIVREKLCIRKARHAGGRQEYHSNKNGDR